MMNVTLRSEGRSWLTSHKPHMYNCTLHRTAENELLNQYWYSAPTIKALVEEIQTSATKVAFLSTPSVYFSLPKV